MTTRTPPIDPDSRKSRRSRAPASQGQDDAAGGVFGQGLPTENELIMMAIRELRGARPPGWEDGASLGARAPDAEARHAGKALAGARSRFRNQLQRELEARGWTPRDLAEASGLSPAEAAALAKGNVRITRETAKVLGRVFATSEDCWLEGE